MLIDMQESERKNSEKPEMLKYMKTVKDIGELLTNLTNLDP